MTREVLHLRDVAVLAIAGVAGSALCAWAAGVFLPGCSQWSSPVATVLATAVGLFCVRRASRAAIRAVLETEARPEQEDLLCMIKALREENARLRERADVAQALTTTAERINSALASADCLLRREAEREEKELLKRLKQLEEARARALAILTGEEGGIDNGNA